MYCLSIVQTEIVQRIENNISSWEHSLGQAIQASYLNLKLPIKLLVTLCQLTT